MGRTGTYILIDMILNKIAKGVKEIDIAATLEYLRDQRSCMIKTKVSSLFNLIDEPMGCSNGTKIKTFTK